MISSGLVIAVIAGAALYFNAQIHRVSVAGLSKSGGLGSQTTNILLVGSTSRCALKSQNPEYGLCSQGVTGVNSDVVMIVHLVPKTRSVSLLSIPRDTFIPNARKAGANKIDAALAEGPTQLVAAIQEDFGIPIQHYIELNFETFAHVVDALGGVKMYFPEPVYDAYSGLRVDKVGCVQLNGVQSLQVVRARHLQYKSPGVLTSDPRRWPLEAKSDLARIRRNHEFLRVLATSVARAGLTDPITDARLASAVAPHLTVDRGLNASALAHLLLTFHSANPATSPQYTLPVSVSTFGSYFYKGGNYGNVVFPTEPADHEVITSFLGEPEGTNTVTGLPLPSSRSVTVTVLNGTGQARQASTIADGLGRTGFVTQVGGSTTPVNQSFSSTVIYYANVNAVGDAQQLRDHLVGNVILALDPSRVSQGSSLTLVTGTGLAVMKPAVSVKQPTSSVSPSPAPPPSTSVNGLQPPTPATEALAPWDPRSCSSAGTAGA